MIHIHKMIRMMKMMKEVVFHQFRRFRHNSKMFYCFVAVMLFIAGLLIGANCFKQNSNSYQIPVAPTPAVVDQNQIQVQSQISPQPAAAATTAMKLLRHRRLSIIQNC